MTKTTIEKAVAVERAMRQLRNELSAAKQPNQVNAINDYILNSNDDSKARLYDILCPQLQRSDAEIEAATKVLQRYNMHRRDWACSAAIAVIEAVDEIRKKEQDK